MFTLANYCYCLANQKSLEEYLQITITNTRKRQEQSIFITITITCKRCEQSFIFESSFFVCQPEFVTYAGHCQWTPGLHSVTLVVA